MYIHLYSTVLFIIILNQITTLSTIMIFFLCEKVDQVVILCFPWQPPAKISGLLVRDASAR